MTISTAVAPRRGRPPKVSRFRLETRQALVRYGTELLTEQGFVSTGIDQILKHLDIPKGSFYHYFASKEEFGLAVIDAYGAYFARKLDRWFSDTSLAPLERLAAFIDDARKGMIRHGYRRGCLIGNLSQEFGAGNEAFAGQLEKTFQDWQRRLASCLDEAKEAGQLAPRADTAQLAAFFWIGWEGAVMRARLTRSDAALVLFSRTFLDNLPE
ncbi:acrylate utilization transcriptional regulator AcuR [Pollutimonas bauzanensis]|uniref:Transcriptional regulator, TetR family n=1 Tax=Pollutimonas bauzanensis TaxID=658167 RepID=A0A1M5R6E8_9BURK|nr:TetR/AcrR family transcriptional regulator [Pollutimonas bauzanensis]SHH21413.1 transcriptional regulator, TetR family [Pollutimonas bauzanensis]